MKNGYKDGGDYLKDSAKFGLKYYATLSAAGYSQQKKLDEQRERLGNAGGICWHEEMLPEERSDKSGFNMYSVERLTKYPAGAPEWTRYYESVAGTDVDELLYTHSVEEAVEQAWESISWIYYPTWKNKHLLKTLTNLKGKYAVAYQLPAPADTASDRAKEVYRELASRLEAQNEELKDLELDGKKMWKEVLEKAAE